MPTKQQMIRALDLDTAIEAEVNGRINGVNNQTEWESGYQVCPEATMTADKLEGPFDGKVIKFADWNESKVYPGTTRNIWVYSTPNIDSEAKSSAQPNVLFFNDGAWYLSRKGPVQVTNVLNYLFYTGEIGPTIAVFVTPGIPDHDVEGPIESYDNVAAQRSLEYDTVSERYGDFLFDELLPLAESTTQVTASSDPTQRIVCGISSGGIAAFSTAWFHHDKCQRVLSHCGSFTDIWGGHHYPSLIRKTPRKPLRVFLQSGENDADTPFGNWALANQTMASALEYAGYDFRFEFGVGGHSLNHGGSIFAESLRWLLR